MSEIHRALPQPSSLRLYVIAGFPKDRERQVVAALERKFPKDKAKFVTSAASQDNNNLYQGSPEALLRAAAGFAIRTRCCKAAEWKPVVPGRLVLLYIPSPDQDLLLSAFAHFAFSAPIEEPEGYCGPCRAWRHDPGLVVAPVERAIKRLLEEDQPLRAMPRDDLRMLPPNNFFCDEGQCLSDGFRSVAVGVANWGDLNRKLELKQFHVGPLPPQVMNGKKKLRCYVDYRGIAFPPSAVGQYHALPRDISQDAPITELQALLKQLYRFGSVIDYGFHHDAQYPSSKPLNGTKFFCAREGEIHVSTTHANVYPNDVVIPG